MLGSRTKQVYAYGKRSQRVINAYDDRKSAKEAPEWKFDDILASTTSAPQPKPSPPQALKLKKLSPKVAKVGGVDFAKPVRRLPLSSIAPNAPSSPAVPLPSRAKRRPTAPRISSLAPASPAVVVDIVVLDGQGRRVSQEHRITKPNVQANVLSTAPAKVAKRPKASVKTMPRDAYRKSEPVVISDSES